jgi:hypothetical protein
MANFWKRLWDDIRPSLIWWILYSIIGGSMLTALFAWIRAIGNSPINGTTAAIIFGFCFFGLMILFLVRRLQAGRSALVGRVPTQMIIYLPILAGLMICIWAYFIGVKVQGVNEDVRHIKAQMVRYVLPRKLTPEQIASIGEYLSLQDRNQVVFQIISRDEEASSFRADIQQALEKGGWAISDFKYADDVQEGLRISMVSPMPPTPAPVNPYDRVNLKPTPIQILSEAFKRAGVQIQGTGSGGGISITATTITISIGHRRRDTWAVLPPNYEAGMRPHTPVITDDDDFGSN